MITVMMMMMMRGDCAHLICTLRRYTNPYAAPLLIIFMLITNMVGLDKFET